jgi:hypothetical protein
MLSAPSGWSTAAIEEVGEKKIRAGEVERDKRRE